MFPDLLFPLELYYFDSRRKLARITSNREWIRAVQLFLTDRLADCNRLST